MVRVAPHLVRDLRAYICQEAGLAGDLDGVGVVAVAEHHLEVNENAKLQQIRLKVSPIVHEFLLKPPNFELRF